MFNLPGRTNQPLPFSILKRVSFNSATGMYTLTFLRNIDVHGQRVYPLGLRGRIEGDVFSGYTLRSGRTLDPFSVTRESGAPVLSRTIETIASPSNGGTVSGGGTLALGSDATLRAMPNAGWSFDGWYEADTLMSEDATWIINVDSNRRLYARFTNHSGVDGTPQLPDAVTHNLDRIAAYSLEARLMFNMILRTRDTRYIRPFAEYGRPVEIARDMHRNNNARMQDAYINALRAMLRGDVNTHQEHIDALRDATLDLILPVQVIAFFSGMDIATNIGGHNIPPDVAYEQLHLLLLMYENTNDNNLRDAIRFIIGEYYPRLFDHLWMIVTEVGGLVFFETLSTVTVGISDIIQAPFTLNRIRSDGADRIMALEGIRQALWGAYGQIVDSGRHNNVYSEDDLLFAHNLFMLMSYVTREQNSWASLRAMGFFGDTILAVESEQASIAGAPAWYPYSFSRDLERSDEMVNRLSQIEGATFVSHDPSSWAAIYVRRAIWEGLVPQNLRSYYTEPITRAEFAQIAVVFYERQRGVITGRSTFADTNDINVQKAAYRDIVRGVGGNNFQPNREITRQEAAFMLAQLANALGSPLPTQAPRFDDYYWIASWAVDAVGSMQATGIMRGLNNYEFGPIFVYERQQSIITMVRLLDWIS
jgi:hypothetical protein